MKKKFRRSGPDKVLSSLLYTYVKPVNRRWVIGQARKRDLCYSQFLDSLLSHVRREGIETTAK